MTAPTKRRRRWIGGWTTPRGLLLRAALIAVLYLVLHAAGLRPHTSILSGTMPEQRTTLAIALAGVYITAYFAFVVLAPILVLAAGILFVLLRLTERSIRSTPNISTDTT